MVQVSFFSVCLVSVVVFKSCRYGTGLASSHLSRARPRRAEEGKNVSRLAPGGTVMRDITISSS